MTVGANRDSESRSPAPLSRAQQGLWYLDQLDPGNPAYNMPVAFRLTGVLEIGALQRALEGVVARHEALRTIFAVDGDSPVQITAPVSALELPVETLEPANGGGLRTELEDLLVAEATRPFSLSSEPLIRAKLVRLAESEHVLVLVVHHIVCDGWSLGIVLHDLADLYNAAVRGEDAALADLPAQYTDFCRWQQDFLQSNRLGQHLRYWREALQGLTAVLSLPLDHPRPPQLSLRGATVARRLPGRLSERLTALHRNEGVTLFMLLLAAWEVLLSRYTAQTDLAVGSPSSNRHRQELEGIVGYLVNNLVLRADLTGDPTFRELLARVKSTCIAAYRHQDCPYETLVEELRPERDLSYAPLFQVMFDVQGAMPKPELTGLRVEIVEVPRKTTHFDLGLSIKVSHGQMQAVANYSTDLFEAATIDRMLGHFETLLESIVDDPEQRISGLQLLPDHERREILTSWNDTAVEFDRGVCIHDLVAAQAKKTPDADAVVCGSEHLSYAELDARASRLAHRLAAVGVGPDILVGIYMKRSLDLPVALLAILKAGGAYVPLDPGYPRSRIDFMLEDAGVAAVLTQAHLSAELPQDAAKIILIDDHADRDSDETEAPETGVTPDNLAYVMYTSGSTGRPKGVMVEHRNVVNFFKAMDNSIGQDASGTWLAVTSVSFDISVLELFWTLTRGFTVVIQGDQDVESTRRGGSRLPDKQMDFSLFYFAAAEGVEGDKYELLMEGAKFADANGFRAIWTPERHFHAFGGLYPNPSVIGAAIASVTERLQIRAGSVVLPLHDPIRVAEEWSLVDNLSGGRVGVSFASGWHDRDFVFSPDSYEDRKEIMFQGIETVQRLWRGERIKRRSGSGREIEVATLPRPVQSDLPTWVTASGSLETIERAGAMGANLLTHLLSQSVSDLAEKIAVYREAWNKAGHGSGEGHVTVMLHTFVGDDINDVKERVRGPLTGYLRTATDLFSKLATGRGEDLRSAELTEQDMEDLLDHAFERYFSTSGLLGTPETCVEMVDRLKEVGVDEVACLVDFGVETESVLASLPNLARLVQLSEGRQPASAADSIDRQIAAHGVTHMQCTPSLAALVVADEKQRPSLAALRKLLIGGEAFPPPLARELASLTSAEIHNMYGPTETTIWSSTFAVDGQQEPMLIGRPVANTRFYVLDANRQIVPVGVPGELYIGGAGVVRGYLNRPQLTSERFVSSPFDANDRLYRTGDLVRYRSDGNLEFLGRLDDQIKIRGNRVELGEIEALLTKHPSIERAVARVWQLDTTDRRIAAYVVPAAGEAPTVSELRRFLRAELPDYMIPQHIIEVDNLPRTPNNKIDRAALPSPLGAVVVDREFREPRNQTEKTIAHIWREALGVDRIGVHDNFFDLGGHSLLSARVVARIRQTTGVQLPLRAIMQGTLEQVAAEYERQATEQPS